MPHTIVADRPDGGESGGADREPVSRRTPEVAVVLGTRPEAVKLAPVIAALRRSQHLSCRVYSTGQQREVLDQTLTDLGLRIEEDLHLMRADQSLGPSVSLVVSAVATCFEKRRPALTVVQGDTTTAVGAALASFYAGVRVAHVEAGLRTGDLRAPFPEEGNRRVIAAIADFHFAPTVGARANLLAEGVNDARIFVTGNTGIDGIVEVIARIRRGEIPPPVVAGRRPGNRLVLVTGHRRENFGAALDSICQALGDLATNFPGVDFVWPVHLNPNVQQAVQAALGAAGHPNVLLVPPVAYGAFVALMAEASLIITDSGGVQEEAPSLGTPMLVTRAVSDRPEGLDGDAMQLVGSDRATLAVAAATILRASLGSRSALTPAPAPNPYGDGMASSRIVRILEAELRTAL